MVPKEEAASSLACEAAEPVTSLLRSEGHLTSEGRLPVEFLALSGKLLMLPDCLLISCLISGSTLKEASYTRFISAITTSILPA